MRRRVSFYHELLQEQASSSKDLEYWLDYVVEFGVDHLIPEYDGMSVFEYNNGQIWCLFAALFIAPIMCLCAACSFTSRDVKKQVESQKVEDSSTSSKKKSKKK